MFLRQPPLNENGFLVTQSLTSPPNQLLVMQWIAVYNMNDKDVNVLYSVRSIASELNDEGVLRNQLPFPPSNRVQNVVMLDYLDAVANRAIYQKNL